MTDPNSALINLSDEERFALLSSREREVCQLVVDGLSNAQIADHLEVAVQTIKVHMRNAFKKLGIIRRIELIRFIKPRVVSKSLQSEFEKGDEMILDLIAGGLTDQEVTDIINENSDPAHQVEAREVRVVVGRLRRWTGIETRTALAIWWLHHRGKFTLADDAPTDKTAQEA